MNSKPPFKIAVAQVHAGTISHLIRHLTNPETPTIVRLATKFDLFTIEVAIPYSGKFAVFILLLRSAG
jgi:hypothetical protein